MKVRQLSVFLENKPGALNRPVNLLAAAGLNVLALSLADTQEFGILRLILREPDRAKALLEAEGCVVNMTDMIAIEVSDAPGTLAEILSALEGSRVNLEYMYGFTQRNGGNGLLLFRFTDPDRAVDALQRKGINPVRSVELLAGQSP